MKKPVTTRRDFLQSGLTMLAAGMTVPAFINKTAYGIGDPFLTSLVQKPTGIDGKILVVIQLSGGNDGLSSVVPYADDAYHRVRPAIRHAPDDVLKLTDYVGLNAQMAPLKELFDNGQMAIVQGVGYPNPNRSHFSSMDIWHTANPNEEAIRSGWLGRYFDAQCSGTDPKTGKAKEADPQMGISIGEANRIAMQGEQVMPLSFESPRDYQYRGRDRETFEKLNKTDGHVDEASTEAGELDFLTRTAMDAQVSSDRVLQAISGHNPSAKYPGGGFGNDLKTVAAMIKGELPTRVYYVSLGGFDTHANQRNNHDRLMQQFAQGVAALLEDLKEQGNDQRVAVMTFSEFGRRVEQNASGGTDHGAAAPMFFFGHNEHINPGVHGNHPSLVDLDAGDLKYQIDFRNCYAGMLQGWLDTDPATCAQILGGQFNPLPLVRA